ncbi:hypothetical protein UG55_108729 [Frankia sp. EI5c]|uniref:hypothetical protein n=1 Tax=Frankia sp. EI5c TaxID=683316 RepID=UPI0007C27F23|nr:hypothetical protein [Frankia sp. EI5c]OAA19675.1 hypothetical protein UG55_108729 [Frankia sp. EI5c]
MTTDSRADRFVRELGELKIPDPAAGRPRFWVRLGVVLMVVGGVLAITAYATSHGTRDPLVQRDAITLGLGGITAAVVGAALFLRYSLTGFLRFWMARQSFDLALLGDRLVEPVNGGELVAATPVAEKSASITAEPSSDTAVSSDTDTDTAAKATVSS